MVLAAHGWHSLLPASGATALPRLGANGACCDGVAETPRFDQHLAKVMPSVSRDRANFEKRCSSLPLVATRLWLLHPAMQHRAERGTQQPSPLVYSLPRLRALAVGCDRPEYGPITTDRAVRPPEAFVAKTEADLTTRNWVAGSSTL
jgi:hypothetical protein